MRTSRNLLIFLITLLFGGILVFSNVPELAIRKLSGIIGNPHSLGMFRNDDNAGQIHFVPMGDPQMIGNTLSGYIWLDTVGWTMFHDAEFLPDAGNIRNPWVGSGFAWTDNAGWIDFSTVTYDPNTLMFSGYAWSDALGWIPMGAGSLPSDSIIAGQVGSGFIGKVKIIGNIGSSRIYDVLYGVGDRYSSLSMAEYTNLVRKNVSILTRNLSASSMNTFPYSTNPNKINNFSYFRNTDSTVKILKYSDIKNHFQSAADDMRSIIVSGADVYVDTGVLMPNGFVSPHAIIALKNDAGVGGNIYVDGKVTRIQASLFAEGSIYSGYMNASSVLDLYNGDKEAAGSMLPDYQLYVRGSVISHNTIGGSSFTGSVPDCPFTETNCNYDTAIRYDLNYFRDFQTTSDPLRRGYKDATLDTFSVIIEHDPKVIATPPPGLAL